MLVVRRITMKNEQRVLDYIAVFEELNGQLVTALKQCLKVLSKLQIRVDWEKRLKDLDEISELGHNIV
jgi:hypothetical protein